jgi:vacuolar protein sorting-associated protein 72
MRRARRQAKRPTDRSNAHGAAAQLMEDQDGADTEFWNQEFFAEEGRDDEYATESESEDKADTDFSGSEEDDDEEGGDGAEAKERCV